MADLRTCRNNILDELNRTGRFTSQAHTAIQTAIDYHKKKFYWFNEERATNNTQDGVEYYDLPADYGEVISLNINVNNNVYTLNERTHEEMERMYVHSSNYKGEPQDFEIIRNELRLGPIPSSARTLEMVYRKEPSTATAETDTNIFLLHAEPMIRWRAAGQMAFTVLQDDQRANGFAQLTAAEEQALTSESNRRRMRGSGKRRRQYGQFGSSVR